MLSTTFAPIKYACMLRVSQLSSTICSCISFSLPKTPAKQLELITTITTEYLRLYTFSKCYHLMFHFLPTRFCLWILSIRNCKERKKNSFYKQTCNIEKAKTISLIAIRNHSVYGTPFFKQTKKKHSLNMNFRRTQEFQCEFLCFIVAKDK